MNSNQLHKACVGALATVIAAGPGFCDIFTGSVQRDLLTKGEYGRWVQPTGPLDVWAQSQLPAQVIPAAKIWVRRVMRRELLPLDLDTGWTCLRLYRGLDTLVRSWSRDGAYYLAETGYGMWIANAPAVPFGNRMVCSEAEALRLVHRKVETMLLIQEGTVQSYTVDIRRNEVEGGHYYHGTLWKALPPGTNMRNWREEIMYVTDGSSVAFNVPEVLASDDPPTAAAQRRKDRFVGG